MRSVNNVSLTGNPGRAEYAPDDRTEEIVWALEHFLRQHPRGLTDRRKLLVRDAIGHAYRGHFRLAAENLCLLQRDESEWPAPVAPAMVAGLTRTILENALRELKRSPIQFLPPRMEAFQIQEARDKPAASKA